MLTKLQEKPGSFATDGVLKESPLPGLDIKGIGPISFPLGEEQAKKIISVAKQAPFGLGEKTLVDEKVRYWNFLMQIHTNIVFSVYFQEKLYKIDSTLVTWTE